MKNCIETSLQHNHDISFKIIFVCISFLFIGTVYTGLVCRQVSYSDFALDRVFVGYIGDYYIHSGIPRHDISYTCFFDSFIPMLGN